MSDSYAAYSKTVDADEARALFQERRGYAPLEVLDAGPIWLAGPIKRGSGLHGELLRGEQAALPLGDNGNGNGRPGGLMRRATAASRSMTAGEARQLAIDWEATR